MSKLETRIRIGAKIVTSHGSRMGYVVHAEPGRVHVLVEGWGTLLVPVEVEAIQEAIGHGLDAEAIASLVAMGEPLTYEAIDQAGDRIGRAAHLWSLAPAARAAGAVAGAIGWAALCSPPVEATHWRQWAMVAVGMLAVSWAGQAAARAAWLWLAGWTRLMEEWADA